MRLTEHDKKVFKALSTSELGKSLVEYLKRLQDEICDSRNWGPGETKEFANKVASLIQTEVCDKIVLQNEVKHPEKRDFE